MKKVFIVGAGQMGLDIGQVMAKTGYQVVFNDMSEEILATQVGKLEKSLDKMVSKGKMTEEKKAEEASKERVVPSGMKELIPEPETEELIEQAVEETSEDVPEDAVAIEAGEAELQSTIEDLTRLLTSSIDFPCLNQASAPSLTCVVSDPNSFASAL